jgi:hypothetical protein
LKRRTLPLVAVGALGVSLVGAGPPVGAQEPDLAPFVSIMAAPEGAQVVPGEHFDGSEFDNSRPLAQGAVGPLPVFFADDGYGCQYTTAVASGLTEWIALARRSQDPNCFSFQARLTAATAAGADGLILINEGPGHSGGVAAGVIPMIMIDQTQGERLRSSLDATKPDAVKVRMGLLDLQTLLPPDAIRPTTVSSLSAERSGGTVMVRGQTSFGGQTPLGVGTDDPGDPPLHPEAARFGVDATSISVGQPVPGGPVEFVIKVTQLSSQPPPEVVRYLWQFTVAGKEYWVQAKTSDLTTTTILPDDAPGAVTHIPGSFRLRGDCQTVGVVATCKHLAWLSGSFDTGQDEVHIRLPLGLEVAPVIAPGAVIEPEDGMTASFQASISNASTSDTVAQEEPYTITSREVAVGIVPAGSDPAYTTTATVNEDGSFSADLDVSGRGSGTYDVVSKACFGRNCGTKSVPITL